jgi:hypothetical protein
VNITIQSQLEWLSHHHHHHHRKEHAAILISSSFSFDSFREILWFEYLKKRRERERRTSR